MSGALLLSLCAAAPAAESTAPLSDAAAAGIGLWEGLLLGLVQGVTEFLPVSSSGHLAIGHLVWGGGGGEAARAFDVAVHCATLFAMMLYFRDDLVALLTKRPRLITLIVLGSVPAGLLGLLLHAQIEGLAENAWAVGAFLMLNGLVLLTSRYFGVETKRLDDLRPSDSLMVGLAQALGLLPGVSRSGATITGGLVSGLRRNEAFVFSFLLGMPLIAAATAWKLRDIGNLAISTSWNGLVAGFAAAFVSGLVAAWVLARLVRQRNLLPFGIYTLVLGLLVIAVKLVRTIAGG